MTDEFPGTRSAAQSDHTLRMVREPAFTGVDIAAYVVIFIMVCGPLAMGAFRL